MDWQKVKQLFPDGYELVQEWFNEITCTNSKSTPFWKQPIWSNDLVLLALDQKAGLRVECDAKFVKDKNIFRYIYVVMSDSDNIHLEPDSHYANRLIAESHGMLHAFKWIKHKKEQANKPEEAQVDNSAE